MSTVKQTKFKIVKPGLNIFFEMPLRGQTLFVEAARTHACTHARTHTATGTAAAFREPPPRTSNTRARTRTHSHGNHHHPNRNRPGTKWCHPSARHHARELCGSQTGTTRKPYGNQAGTRREPRGNHSGTKMRTNTQKTTRQSREPKHTAMPPSHAAPTTSTHAQEPTDPRLATTRNHDSPGATQARGPMPENHAEARREPRGNHAEAIREPGGNQAGTRREPRGNHSGTNMRTNTQKTTRQAREPKHTAVPPSRAAPTTPAHAQEHPDPRLATTRDHDSPTNGKPAERG